MLFSKLPFLLSLTLAGSTLSGAALGSNSAVGMVLQAKGKAELTRGGSAQPLRIADSLEAGDRITASEGQVVFLFCPTSETLTMSEGSTVALTADSVAVVSGSGLQKQRARRCSIPEVALGAESLERVGGLRARGYPPIPIFVGGPLSTARPLFQWAPLEGDPEYQLTVKNDLGAEVWKTTVKGGHEVAYPESAPPLAPGHYAWELMARVDGRVAGQQTARFEIKPSRESFEPAGDDAGSRLVAAAALENAGYYSQAAALFRQLRDDYPDDERFTRRLAWLYWNSGLITAANAERKRLDQGQ